MKHAFSSFGVALAMLASAGVASAQMAAGSGAQAEPATTAQADVDEQQRDRLADRFCVRETGSRIKVAQRAGSRDDRKQCLVSNGRSYSRDDLRDTGRTDLGDALRALDPAIH